MDRLIESSQLEGWIPVRIYWRNGQPIVDWCYLGRDRFEDPFFEQTVGECLRHPFNLLFRRLTPMEVLGEWSEARPGLLPTGFIFHMSRCGSTLISQMLAAAPKNIVISEARPIDSTLRAHFHSVEITDKQRISWLRWMVSALGQRRLGGEKHLFIKFDAWNTSELPFIRQAFPDVPWVFVYRDPVEVMISQLNQRGAHMVPGVIAPSLFGLDAETITTIEPEEYCARVLASICQAALRDHQNGGLLINYKQLPDAVGSTISKFFGVSWTAAESEIMKDTARLHAKNRAMVFQDDSAKKQQKATDRVREAVSRWLQPVYEELEAARKAQLPV
jgi:hypothetical protein